MPIIFWIALIGLIGVVAAFVILELTRPYPDKRRQREAEREEKERQYRRENREKRLEQRGAEVQAEIDEDVRGTMEQLNKTDPDENIPDTDSDPDSGLRELSFSDE